MRLLAFLPCAHTLRPLLVLECEQLAARFRVPDYVCAVNRRSSKRWAYHHHKMRIRLPMIVNDILLPVHEIEPFFGTSAVLSTTYTIIQQTGAPLLGQSEGIVRGVFHVLNSAASNLRQYQCVRTVRIAAPRMDLHWVGSMGRKVAAHTVLTVVGAASEIKPLTVSLKPGTNDPLRILCPMKEEFDVWVAVVCFGDIVTPCHI